MKFNPNKKRVLLILFSVSSILLIANLVLNIIDEEKISSSDKTKLSNAEIDSLFLLSLHSFGLKEEWIEESTITGADKSYRVRVPDELSIPVILAEINLNYLKSDASISSVEKISSGKTILIIQSDNEFKLKAEFNYDKNIFRLAGTAAFILDHFELSSSEDSLLLETPEPFSALLIPSAENLVLSKFIIDKQKSYSLLLNDDIPELKYRLKDSYSENRLRSSLISIINDFSSATYFFIDDQSDLFNSAAFTFIKGELVKRNINIAKLSDLQKLDVDEIDILISSFDTFMKNTDEGESIIFLINADSFRNLLPEIKSYRKVGYKIVHPSEIKSKENIK